MSYIGFIEPYRRGIMDKLEDMGNRWLEDHKLNGFGIDDFIVKDTGAIFHAIKVVDGKGYTAGWEGRLLEGVYFSPKGPIYEYIIMLSDNLTPLKCINTY